MSRHFGYVSGARRGPDKASCPHEAWNYVPEIELWVCRRCSLTRTLTPDGRRVDERTVVNPQPEYDEGVW